VVNLTNFFMGGLNDAAMFKWSVWTNLIVAVGPINLWAARKSRHGTSMGLAIMVLLFIIATYLPPGYGMWTTASSYFNTPWFYISGVIATGYAIYDLILVKNSPPNPHSSTEARPLVNRAPAGRRRHLRCTATTARRSAGQCGCRR
jgi:hypothetical protein